MRHVRSALLAIAAGIAACAGAPANQDQDAGPGMAGSHAARPSGYGASVDRDVARVRAATAAFRSLDGAVAAGYPRSVPQCLAHAEHGAMGYHHAKNELLDDRLEVERPEILVYERTAEGEYVLNGVEYIVPYSARPRDAEPPTIMGQNLKRADRLRLWYLHVWVWKENPAGLFADWNPDVTCRS